MEDYPNTLAPQQRGDATKERGECMLLLTYLKKLCLLWALLDAMKDVPWQYVVLLSTGRELDHAGFTGNQAANCYGPVLKGEKRACVCKRLDGTVSRLAFDGTLEGLKRVFRQACFQKLPRKLIWQATYIHKDV